MLQGLSIAQADYEVWYKEEQIYKAMVKIKLDTGAQCNVLPKYIADIAKGKM